MQDFFKTKRLYNAVNCTLVTLILKKLNVNHIKDMRPISCCATIYKIISKIFTTRLGKAIGSVVGDTQSAFIPETERVIDDSVVMTQRIIRGYCRKQISPQCMIQLDIQKTYDSLDLATLESILR